MAQHPPFQRVPHLPIEPNPALVQQTEQRARSIQNRIADRITAFAGSMRFVYIHIAWFGCWIGFGVEDYPYGLLTMIVSLEAIFLSTFVMISQNRADAKRQVDRGPAVADRQGRGQAKRGTARPLAPDPRPDQGNPRGRHPATRRGRASAPRRRSGTDESTRPNRRGDLPHRPRQGRPLRRGRLRVHGSCPHRSSASPTRRGRAHAR